MKIFLKTGCIVCTCFLIAALFCEWVLPEITITTASDGHDTPIRSVQTSRMEISLTFDISGGNADISQILDVLEKHQIHASFFVTGEWADRYPEDIKKIAAAGHDLGNHTENHKNMRQLSDEEQRDEIMSLHTKIKQLTGTDMKFFRPPYGDYNRQVMASARECGYKTVLWNCDSLDWKDYGADAIVETLRSHPSLDKGSIILMHNHTRYTAAALDSVLTTLKEMGYRVIPLSEFIL